VSGPLVVNDVWALGPERLAVVDLLEVPTLRRTQTTRAAAMLHRPAGRTHQHREPENSG
jgi:hypothetical protein